MSADNYFKNSIYKHQIEQDENLVLEDIQGNVWLRTKEKDDVGTIPSFTEDGYMYYGAYGLEGGYLARYLYLTYKVLWHEMDVEDYIFRLENVSDKDWWDIVTYMSFKDMVYYKIIEESEIDYSMFDQENALKFFKEHNDEWIINMYKDK